MTPTSTKWLSSTARMARISAHHAWRTISTWVLLLVFVGVASTGRGGASTNEGNFTGKPEAVRADDLLSEHTRGGEGDPLTETILVSSEPQPSTTLRFAQSSIKRRSICRPSATSRRLADVPACEVESCPGAITQAAGTEQQRTKFNSEH